MRALILALCLIPCLGVIPSPGFAQSDPVTRMVDQVILPAFASFAASTARLGDAATADCRADHPDLRAAFQSAFDDWIAVEPYRAGPLETDARGLAIAYWPDLKGNTPKALRALIAAGTIPAGADFAQSSVAARGLFALEVMLYDPAFNTYTATDPGCVLTQQIALDLAQVAAKTNADWQNVFGPLMMTAGAKGNSRFLARQEVVQMLFTAALTELDYIAETRIARPLGTSDRPRPARAEAKASARSLRNVELSIAAVNRLVQVMGDVKAGDMIDRLDYATYAAAKIKDPTFADVITPSGFFRLQELQNAVQTARQSIKVDLGRILGVTEGFNALDGD